MMVARAVAIGWELWNAQRRVLIASCWAFLSEIALFPALMWVSRDPIAIFLAFLPAMFAAGCIMNALIYSGEKAGQIGAGLSPRLFTLPIRTAELVAWPLLYGAVTMFVLWLYVAGLVSSMGGLSVPILLPGLSAAALMVWLQAMSWSPFRYPAITSIVAVVAIATLAAIAIASRMWLNLSVGQVNLLLVAYILAAYVYAITSVARDRVGDGRGRRGSSRRLISRPVKTLRRLKPFRSAQRAQLWYEWRGHGLSLPVACLLLCLFVAALSLEFGGADGARMATLIGFLLLVPVGYAGPIGASLAKLTHFFDPRPTFPTFLAARPMTSVSLATAKLKMSVLSVLATWLLVALVIAIWLLCSGRRSAIIDQWSSWIDRIPGPKSVLLPVAAGVLVLLTWRQYTGTLWQGLSGRPWLLRVGIGLFSGLASVGGGIAVLVLRFPEYGPVVSSLLPWVLVTAAAMRTLIAVAAYRVAYARGMLSGRSIVATAAVWLVVFGLVTAFVKFVLPPSIGGSTVVLPAVALLVPLARFPAAFLALDCNRHR
jgi:hypothetical protein